MKTLLATILVLPLLAQGQKPQAATSAEPAKPAPEEGIPVTNQLVISKCGACHTKDEKGNMLRISWERATPEGWEEAIKRMVRLRGVTLTPDEARSILKYLATYHGLAPEEAKPIMYYAEQRIQDETNIPNDDVQGACANCHAMARPLSWRRSAEDWKDLANLHVALYPQADEAFRLGLNAGGFDEDRHHRDPDAPLPVDVALDVSRQDRSAADSRMGRVARSHACAEARGTVAGFGLHSGPRQVLWRDGSGRGQRNRRRVHHPREADFG